MSYGNRNAGSRVAVRARTISEGDGVVMIYDLLISVGKGRKQAEALRVEIENAIRPILERDCRTAPEQMHDPVTWPSFNDSAPERNDA